MHRFILFSLMILITSSACRNKNSRPYKTSTLSQHKIILQPLNGFDNTLLKSVKDSLERIFKHVQVLENTTLPSRYIYQPRNRFRADSIIHHLKTNASSDQIVVGLIHSDISTTKENHLDWGVMGLGYCPGNACVISSFRLNKKTLHSQFYKVVIHEIGHTLGLPHCEVKACYMRDAEGHNPTNEERGFCKKCNTKFQNKLQN